MFIVFKTQIMRDMVALSDDWWFVVHNADLLAKLDPENDELSQLRDTFILNYAEAMLGDKVIILKNDKI